MDFSVYRREYENILKLFEIEYSDELKKIPSGSLETSKTEEQIKLLFFRKRFLTFFAAKLVEKLNLIDK
jgi:hypothetical protein